jgi:hypothetical protein
LEAVGAGGQCPQWAVEPVEEEEEDCYNDDFLLICIVIRYRVSIHLVNEKVYGGRFVFIWVA